MVVEDKRRTLREVELVGQLEREVGGRDGDLGEPALAAEGGNPVAGLDGSVIGRLAYDAADLATGDEWQWWLVLVLPPGLQQLRE